MGNKKYSLSERADDEYDFDGEPSRKRKHKRDAVPNERSSAKRILTQHERCQFCFENPSRPKHLVISIANFTYMMLPQWQPVVQGHCCILPMQVSYYRMFCLAALFLLYLHISNNISVIHKDVSAEATNSSPLRFCSVWSYPSTSEYCVLLLFELSLTPGYMI